MSSCRRRTTWVTAAAAALAVVLGGGPAAVADSSPLATSHPGLRAAQAISANQVLACFDQILVTPSLSDTSLFLQGYTEARRTGATGGLKLSSTTAAGGGFCVVAAFTGPGDVRSYSTLAVLANAVNASLPGGVGAGNLQSSTPLLGTTLPNTIGATLRPQLVAAAPSGAAAVTYSFDEPLASAAGTHAFGFYTNTAGDSAFHAGTVTNFAPGTTVTVDFTGADATALAQASRFVVGEGAVADANAQTNPIGTVGGATQRADLAPTTGPAAGGPPLTYHFDFTRPLPAGGAVCASRFALYDETGVRYSPAVGAPVTVSPGGSSVTMTFAADAPNGDPAQLTLASVASDGLDAASCAVGATPAPLNSDGVAGLPGTPAKAGSTSGPDLVSFDLNRSTGVASFAFDAQVASGATSPGRFHLVDRSGGLIAPPSQGAPCLLGQPAPQFTVNPANTVNVNFATPTCLLGLLPGAPDLTAIRGAVGVSIDEGAVTDAATGDLNPLASLGVTPTGPTGPTGPALPPIPTVPTPATPTKTTPATPKKPVTTNCRRVLTLHLLTTVSRNLSSATVTINGKKVPVSKKFTVTVAFAKYQGAKSIVVKIKGRLKSHRSVTRTKTYKSKC